VRESERERFDAVLERVLGELPRGLLDLLDEVPLIVLDEPSPEILRSLGVAREHWDEECQWLCGLHSGLTALEQSVEGSGELPEQIHLFRKGVLHTAGGWDDLERLEEEIRVTLLHEIGHHFGLEEDDLDQLGYA
jgi:predicted Zn-dependent protease with MMP-like domain